MPPPIESVLGQVQRDSLEIVDFIFHIIDPEVAEEDRVIFLDEVQLQEKQKHFFLDRLRDVAEGTQYVFKADAVHLKEKCEQLLAESDRFNGCGRDGGYPPPPAQIRTCRITAYGSCLRYVTHRSAPPDRDAYYGRSE